MIPDRKSSLWGYHQGAPKCQILTANISKTVSRRFTFQMWRNIGFTTAFQKCIAWDSSTTGESPIRKNVFFCPGTVISSRSAWNFAWWYVSRTWVSLLLVAVSLRVWVKNGTFCTIYIRRIVVAMCCKHDQWSAENPGTDNTFSHVSIPTLFNRSAQNLAHAFGVQKRRTDCVWCVHCLLSQESVYCYNGECRSHQSQCRTWWGDNANNGRSICYLLNERGVKGWHCDYDIVNDTYSACSSTYVWHWWCHTSCYKIHYVLCILYILSLKNRLFIR